MKLLKSAKPWQTVDSKTVYDNPLISVSHRNVINPTGNKGIYGVVHFKHHAVGILPLDHQGNTWIVQQTRYPHHCKTWEIPEGGATQNEPLLAAAKRELKEETGLSAADWRPLLELQLSNSVTDEKATIYLAQTLTEGAGSAQLEETEDITVRKLPLKKPWQWFIAMKLLMPCRLQHCLKYFVVAQTKRSL